MTKFLAFVFAFLACAATAQAQTCQTPQPVSDWVCVNGGWLPPSMVPKPVTPPTPPAPQVGDFTLKGTIDWAQQIEQQIVISGWQFECRSGLQAITQRLGLFGAQYKDTVHGTLFSPTTFQMSTVERPDVAAAFTTSCPAVGSFVGYGVFTDTPPYPSVWELHIVFRTTDGAGRPLQLDLKTTIDTR